MRKLINASSFKCAETIKKFLIVKNFEKIIIAKIINCLSLTLQSKKKFFVKNNILLKRTLNYMKKFFVFYSKHESVICRM